MFLEPTSAWAIIMLHKGKLIHMRDLQAEEHAEDQRLSPSADQENIARATSDPDDP